jgi:hypothetical protein
MDRFIVVPSSPLEGKKHQLFDGARQVAASLAPGTEWRNSWISAKEGTLFCEWEAPDADTIRTLLEPVKYLFPIETIHEVEWLDPTWYQ